MKTKDDVEKLERLIVELKGLHSEMSQLVKKSPNDGVNQFKLKLINRVLSEGNVVLAAEYRPFGDFAQFDPDDLPTNSDVTMILSQYMEQAERYRSDNVVPDSGRWWYKLVNGPSEIQAAPPSRIGSKE